MKNVVHHPSTAKPLTQKQIEVLSDGKLLEKILNELVDNFTYHFTKENGASKALFPDRKTEYYTGLSFGFMNERDREDVLRVSFDTCKLLKDNKIKEFQEVFFESPSVSLGYVKPQNIRDKCVELTSLIIYVKTNNVSNKKVPQKLEDVEFEFLTNYRDITSSVFPNMFTFLKKIGYNNTTILQEEYANKTVFPLIKKIKEAIETNSSFLLELDEFKVLNELEL